MSEQRIPYNHFLMWTKQAIRDGAPNPSAADSYQIPEWQLRVYKQVYEAGLGQRDNCLFLRNEALIAELNQARGDLDLEIFAVELLSLHKTVKAAGGYVVEDVVKSREEGARRAGYEQGCVDGQREGRLLGAQYAEVGHLVHRLYDAAAPGFHTAESSGFTDDFRQVARFSTLEEMHRHYEAWLNLMVFVRDAKEVSRG